MTAENESFSNTEVAPIPYGKRLKAAREALGLSKEEIAAQFRLNPRIIAALEAGRHPAGLPATYMRGYMRLYGRYLQIPEAEIKKAQEAITLPSGKNTLTLSPINNLTSSQRVMPMLTSFITFTLLSLVGVWWYSHSSTDTTAPTEMVSENNLNSSGLALPAANSAKLPELPAGTEVKTPLLTDNHQNSFTITQESVEDNNQERS